MNDILGQDDSFLIVLETREDLIRIAIEQSDKCHPLLFIVLETHYVTFQNVRTFYYYVDIAIVCHKKTIFCKICCKITNKFSIIQIISRKLVSEGSTTFSLFPPKTRLFLRRSFVDPSLILRCSSVPKSVQSRCKVGGGAKFHRVWFLVIANDERWNFGGNMALYETHVKLIP